MANTNVGVGEIISGREPYFTIGDPNVLTAFASLATAQLDPMIRIVKPGETAPRAEGEVATFAGKHGWVIHPEGTEYIPYPEHPTHAQQLRQMEAEGRTLSTNVINGIAQTNSRTTGYMFN